VNDADHEEDTDLAAGDFSSWLRDMQAALRKERDADVPCAGCTACCTSSQFVHIAADEADTIAHIPSELLFPAPLMPRGNFVLGYDERGHCPMLIDGVCSIYEHRPRTCRTYDCRVFPAAGVELDERDKSEIARRVRRWRFTYPSETDVAEHDAVRVASTFLRTHPESVAEERRPATATQLAVLAVEVYEQFVANATDFDAP
jgi:Fe-S-cluster containining protein